MTYVQIQNAVLSDAFAEAKRDSVKLWIQGRHSWIWDSAPWVFRFGTATVTFTANSQIVGSLPTDFHAAVALYTAQGDPVAPVRDLREFFDAYNANLGTTTGTPAAYTVVNTQMFVGPYGDGSSGMLVYEKTKPTLSADSDTTGLPDGYDLALVHGAKAEGFKLTNVPLWSGFDDDFTAYYNTLKLNYVTKVPATGQQFGAYRVAQWS